MKIEMSWEFVASDFNGTKYPPELLQKISETITQLIGRSLSPLGFNCGHGKLEVKEAQSKAPSISDIEDIKAKIAELFPPKAEGESK